MQADRAGGFRGPVWAMARPRRCNREGALLAMAAVEIGADGSTRAKAHALAKAVARLATLPFTAPDEFAAQLERTAAALA